MIVAGIDVSKNELHGARGGRGSPVCQRWHRYRQPSEVASHGEGGKGCDRADRPLPFGGFTSRCSTEASRSCS